MMDNNPYHTPKVDHEPLYHPDGYLLTEIRKTKTTITTVGSYAGCALTAVGALLGGYDLVKNNTLNGVFLAFFGIGALGTITFALIDSYNKEEWIKQDEQRTLVQSGLEKVVNKD